MYRLYIDEVGNHDLYSSLKPNEQYLNLTGVMIDQDYCTRIVTPQLEDLKRRYLDSDPDDDPVILHRKEMLHKSGRFKVFEDRVIEAGFNEELIDLLIRWDYKVFTVTIDKRAMLEKYTVWQQEPYHYCLKILIERYVMSLKRVRSKGDVLAEARNSTVDKKLKDSYTRLFVHGSDFVKAPQMQARLSTKQLKVKPKKQNIAGLQLADLLAYPCYSLSLAWRKNQQLSDTFSTRIARVIKDYKFERVDNRIEGISFKWLP